MSFLTSIMGLVSKDETPQGEDLRARHSDYSLKGDTYSVESEICEALADLMLMGSSYPIAGDSPRALFLDAVSDKFMRTVAKKAVTAGFGTGDCIVVPSWDGRGIRNMVVTGEMFDILRCSGDEITACRYVLDTANRRGDVYKLIQSMSLEDRGGTWACVYETYVTRHGERAASLSDFPQWESYTPKWEITGVDRLLLGRFKSNTQDPNYPNNPKGVPICFGAGEYIAEIRYLLDQMHTEFDFSEKAVMASRRMFKGEIDESGNERPVMPRGRKRLFMLTRGSAKSDVDEIHEWAPEIRYQAYLDAIDKQEQLVERAVGVSGGIISRPNDMNYQNVDNVRKSQQKTMAFVASARNSAEDMLSQLLYSWDVLANVYGITPIGDYEPSFDWSSEWIETFADKQNALLAGNSIGAIDAVDYRMFVMGESPEAARQRVAEIQAGMTFEDVI